MADRRARERALTLVAGSPFSDSGVGTLAGRYADLLEGVGWRTRILAPVGVAHRENGRQVEQRSYAGLFAEAGDVARSGVRVLVLGLPRERGPAQQAISALAQLPRAALLWERPNTPNSAVGSDLSGLDELRHVWTLNARHALTLRRQLPHATVSVAPISLPPAFFADTPMPRPVPHPYAVYLGRFADWKGAPRLAEVWADRVYPRTGTVLLMIGHGLEPGTKGETAVVEIAQRHPERLSLIQTSEITARVALLRHADAAIFPGRYEHLPQALIEAMAVGVPTVCTAIDGYAPVARHRETSLLIDLDLDGLEAAVVELRDNASLRASLSARARREVQQSFTAQPSTLRLEALLDALC
ncbi:glycosyltransferase [Streptomyces sp. NPDC006733]|uniref:glycosyltransferase family 4 protein n=1 Tax=Streptomyces sp. NPDC006733 TaxID=3155460 RepID=UPI00340C9D63